ncbi:DUF1223 domain-containing protein [Dyadobacter luticola]|uniref:DUF1223 domain-containing protein n=1 Tax=Dyadobacter luticola TaxID=1979387 RepID=A0A5R9KVX5_9BACT|nr:DUF1223 domain-containing protein [Dyadobacter luticola]TLV00394.1 DUF1223 domain-containing protein [Dyadobacter luticola]
MKRKDIFVFATSFILITTLFIGAGSSKPVFVKNTNENGFVFLELFTSEGCSSCPRADELLGNVQKQSGDKPIYILAYHVDYWDHNGWKDMFSSAENTKRQYWYANKLKSQVYTPQVVANGKTVFVGSNKTALTNALENNVQASSTNTLKLTGKREAGKMAITYRVSGSKDAELMIATAQKNAERQIKNGENSGRTLHHVQIVRKLDAFKLSNMGVGQVNILLPNEFTAGQWEVVGFLQDKRTGEISAADRL